MLNEKQAEQRVEKLVYFNEYAGNTSELTILENAFLLMNYFFFIIEEKMENELREKIENLGFSVSYLHCYTKSQGIDFKLFEEKMAFGVIEKEGKEEEILVKIVVSHQYKEIRRVYCDNVYAPKDLVDEISALFEALLYKQKRLKYLVEQYKVISQFEED